MAYGTDRLLSDVMTATGPSIASNLYTTENEALLARSTSWSRNRISNGMNTIVEEAGKAVIVISSELPELIGELRRVSGRRDLAAVVISSSFPDELRNELQMLDRVFLLNVPVNFALLSRILRESAGAGKRTQAS